MDSLIVIFSNHKAPPCEPIWISQTGKCHLASFYLSLLFMSVIPSSAQSYVYHHQSYLQKEGWGKSRGSAALYNQRQAFIRTISCSNRKKCWPLFWCWLLRYLSWHLTWCCIMIKGNRQVMHFEMLSYTLYTQLSGLVFDFYRYTVWKWSIRGRVGSIYLWKPLSFFKYFCSLFH